MHNIVLMSFLTHSLCISTHSQSNSTFKLRLDGIHNEAKYGTEAAHACGASVYTIKWWPYLSLREWVGVQPLRPVVFVYSEPCGGGGLDD